MRTLPPALQASLVSGATTLCWCWRITRSDGEVLGFTDHDRDLAFDGVVYARASLRASGAVDTRFGVSGGGAAVSGVIDDGGITAEDIERGAFEAAVVDLFRVDWNDTASRVHFWSGTFGEITFSDLGFEVELLGRHAALERSIGRVYQRRCDARIGDARCTVDLDQATFRAEATVGVLINAQAFRVEGLDAFDDGWFADGALVWLTGPNSGAVSTVASHRSTGEATTIEVRSPTPAAVVPGDTFRVDAGCDKRWRTCKDKFANVVNFRGFPMIPGDDWLQAGPRSSERNDGGSLWTDRDG